MSGMKKSVQGDKEVLGTPDEGSSEPGVSRTAGTDRDLDESGESKNQGHGHGGTGTDRGEDAGLSERTVTETDRSERNLEGPGGG
jgi:hypothetical protein